MKKGKNMINQKNDLNMITRKLETELLTFHFDDLEISEITTKTSWMKLHINVLFIKDNVQITKVLYKDYETGLWYYIKNDGMIISHKDTFNHTIKNLVDEMIYDCHIEIEETEATEEAAEAEETKGKETEETEKSQYFDTDSVQPNKIAKIENINHCPNQNTCCIFSPYVHCDYNYKSDACIKAHNNFNHYCEQVHKQLKAKHNPEWHHVNLETLRNIDFNMIDKKRRLYIKVYKMTVNVTNTIYKCNRFSSIDNLRTNLLQTVRNMAKNGMIEWALVEYVKAKLDNCYLVNHLQSI